MKENEARDLMQRNQERFLDHLANCRREQQARGLANLTASERANLDLTLRRVTVRLKDWS